MSGNQFDIQDSVGYVSPMRTQPKQTVVRDPDYLKWIRTLPCSACGTSSAVAHHHPAAGHSSVGLKCDDTRAIPLCPICHHRVHSVGKASFWGDLDAVETMIARLNIRFFFAVDV